MLVETLSTNQEVKGRYSIMSDNLNSRFKTRSTSDLSSSLNVADNCFSAKTRFKTLVRLAVPHNSQSVFKSTLVLKVKNDREVFAACSQSN